METNISLGSSALVEMELWLEVINLGIALWVLWLVYGMKDRVKGTLGHVWNLLALTVVAFAVVEMIGVLTLTNVADFAGWADIAELVLVVSLLLVVNHLKKVK
jgi:hypothetical protein